MYYIVLVVLMGFLWGYQANGDSIEQNKIAQLTEFAKTHPYNLISLNTANYRDFILKNPRNYHVFVLYTADKKYCADCPKVERRFGNAARSYFHSQGPIPVFFALVDAYSERQIVEIHNMQSVPLMIHTAPKSLKKAGGIIKIAKADTYTQPRNPSPQELLTWMKHFTDREVKEYHSIEERTSLFITALFSVGSSGVCLVSLWWLVLKFPIIITFLAIVVQYLATCGFYYNVAHGMQWKGYDQQTRAPIHIAKSPRVQYLGEGLLCSGLMMGAGLSLVCMVLVPFVGGSKTHNKYYRWYANVLLFVFLGLFLVCAFALNEVYVYKSMWYHPSFYPPPGYVKGPWRLDRGNSF
eukprot:Platyproteum_vivax@DN3873_c0_g1_i1.p1